MGKEERGWWAVGRENVGYGKEKKGFDGNGKEKVVQ